MQDSLQRPAIEHDICDPNRGRSPAPGQCDPDCTRTSDVAAASGSSVSVRPISIRPDSIKPGPLRQFWLNSRD